MGWLKAEAQLIQAPNWQANGAAHAATDEARAELPVPALGTCVPCVRLAGGSASDAEVVLDAGFEFCPQLSRHGYPVMLKREPEAATETGGGGGGGSTGRDEAGFGGWKVTPDELALKVLFYRLMSAPGEGLSPLWELGGSRGARPPPVLAARADGLPFGAREWAELRELYDARAPVAWQMRHVEAVCSDLACLTEDDFEAALREWCAPRAWVPPARTLAQRYPLGARVEARDLSRTEMNGRVGTVAAHDDARGRVGVAFEESAAPLALRPRNLLLLS